MFYLLLFEKKKERKKRKERNRGLFHRADTPYWLSHAGIFLAARCNQKLF
jgi:hypothetical protein